MNAPRPQITAVGSQGWADQRELKMLARRRVLVLGLVVGVSLAIGFWLAQ